MKKKLADKKLQPLPVEMSFARPPATVPHFYANRSQITTSLNDTTVIFCTEEHSGNAPAVINPQVVVHMTHRQAEAFAKVVSDQVAQVREQLKQLQADQQKEGKK